MFDQLFEESPMIQKKLEQYRTQFLEQGREQGFEQGLEKGREEGLAQGKVLTRQEILVEVVRARYPDLEEFAQQQACQFDQPDALDRLILQVMSAPNASTVRRLFEADPET